MTGLTDAVETSGELLEVPLSILRPDTIAEFTIFLKTHPDKPPVLYREKNLPIDGRVLENISGHKYSHIYVPADEKTGYFRYVERNLGKLIHDDSIPADQKASLAYQAAQGLLIDGMEDPRVHGVIERSTDVVHNLLEFMNRERTAFSCLVNVLSRDYYTYTHCVNVFVFAVSLARAVGVSDRDSLQAMGQGAILHDIGKCRIDDAVLNKPGKLTDEEWEEMKRHPELGCLVLKEGGNNDPVSLDVVAHHHEKLDGSGYPERLSGSELTPFAKISTIVDIFDALTTKRPYKDAIGTFPALKLMKEEMGSALDPEYFRALVMLMSNSGGRTSR